MITTSSAIGKGCLVDRTIPIHARTLGLGVPPHAMGVYYRVVRPYSTNRSSVSWAWWHLEGGPSSRSSCGKRSFNSRTIAAPYSAACREKKVCPPDGRVPNGGRATIGRLEPPPGEGRFVRPPSYEF